MGKYGFNEEPPQDNITAPIALPKPKSKTTDKPAAEAVKEAVRAGEKLGFVSREPAARPQRKPGRRKAAEPQDQVLITGPQRVIDAFRDYCEREHAPTYWAGLQKLLDRS